MKNSIAWAIVIFTNSSFYLFNENKKETTSKGCLCGRGEGTRTPGPLVPNQMRYQTALRLVSESYYIRGVG